MIKYRCEKGHVFEVPCVDSLSGTPHYTCPECGSEDCHKEPLLSGVMFPNMKNPITISDELAREFVDWARIFTCNTVDSHICSRLAKVFKSQLDD